MTEGIIVKGIGGFYYVKTEADKLYQCKARGLFRKDGIIPYVGDRVSIDAINNEEALITKILPRRNLFIRPPVANVDCFIITSAARSPEPNFYIIDKFLIMAEFQHTDGIICINKTDLTTAEEIEAFLETYRSIYPVVAVSGKTGEGMDELIELLGHRKCAFAGPSGTGKSTLLNRMLENADMETGEVSEKTGRGRHTTRHVELFNLPGGGMVFDTPGFTSFEIISSDEQELAFLYPEMRPFNGQCRYHNCRHLSEPGCRVRAAIDEGSIPPTRYDSYCRQMKEIQEKRRY